jgi:hypothetical protein
MGLYTQQDPIGIAGGLNLYGYANGDPINFSDPFGLNPWPVPVPQVLVGCAVLFVATGAAAFLASSMLSDATSEDELTRPRREPGRSVWEWVRDAGRAAGQVLGGLLGDGPPAEMPELLPPPPAIEVPDTRPTPTDTIVGGGRGGDAGG